MNELVINNTEISTDEEGRFSLNDLHKASGGEIKDLPAKFYRSHNFKKFLEVLMSENGHLEPIVKKSGRYGGGTWVCKELVYKYAMWVNAEFELKVIRVFDQITKKIRPASTMEAVNEAAKKIENDNDLASFHGKELQKHRNRKQENEAKFLEEVKRAQMTLGFEG